MRVGKKLKVVDTKRTRSCVVLLEKVQSPPSVNKQIVKKKPTIVHSGGTISPPLENRNHRGPIKKRPIVHTPTTVSKGKEKSQTPSVDEDSEEVNSNMELTPTIAAGRSRRAIKPNPKYTNEDVLTTKMIKNVAHLASSVSRKMNNSMKSDHKRKGSTSSSEDFYNKDSSDEIDFIDMHGNKERIQKDYITDPGFTYPHTQHEEPRVVRGRGRPRKIDQLQLAKARALAEEAAAMRQQAAAGKSLSSMSPSSLQVQNMKKHYIGSGGSTLMNSSGSQQTSIKRKASESPSLNDSDNGSDTSSKRRRAYLLPGMRKEDTSSALHSSAYPLNHRTFLNRKSITAPTLNGNKVIHGGSTNKSDGLQLDRRKEYLEASPNRSAMKVLSSTKRVQNPIMDDDDDEDYTTTKKSSTYGPRMSLPANRALKAAKDEVNANKSLAGGSNDDFEAMPTFTIVNINDIINKKGDALISKAANSLAKSPLSKDIDDASETEDSGETKHVRRRMVSSKASMEKGELARMKGGHQATTKPTQTILNHTLMNKHLNRSNQRASMRASIVRATTAANKPAPRILNAMVAKKTQPVKPMIANMDDSCDETSYPLSLEDDTIECEEKADLPAKGGHANVLHAKSGGAKENSSMASSPGGNTTLSDSVSKAIQRKMSPEKVVITRQGDKIVKKITCFETWYIISIPEEQPSEVVRNEFDIPLITLANSVKDVELPSDEWSTKVTLYQVGTGLMNKPNYVAYNGDLSSQNISEDDRRKYQPSCVMFRRAVHDRSKSRLPYDRAVIFKNKTFFTNIEGKNIKLVGAPAKVSSLEEVAILLQIVDELTLQNAFVEQTSPV